MNELPVEAIAYLTFLHTWHSGNIYFGGTLQSSGNA